MTPLNLQFWGNLYPPTAAILREVALSWSTMVKIVLVLIGLPLTAGMLMNHYSPLFSKKLCQLLKPISFVIFILFVIMLFVNNYETYTTNAHHVLFLVIAHNGIALLIGYLFSGLMRLSKRNQKTIAIETGIQNAALGLLLIFTFFEGLGGMALLASFWGVWDIISGLTIAYFWGEKSKPSPVCTN